MTRLTISGYKKSSHVILGLQMWLVRFLAGIYVVCTYWKRLIEEIRKMITISR